MIPKDFKPGYYDQPLPLDRMAYFSRAKIALALESLEYFFAEYGEGIKRPEPKHKMDGRRYHQAILERDTYRQNRFVHRFSDLRTKEAKDWENRVLREHPGAQIMSLAESLKMDRIIDRVMSHTLAGPLISQAKKEKHGYTICPIRKVILYSRPDIITAEDYIAELKFVQSVSAHDFGRQQYNELWFMQLAFYNAVHRMITGKELKGNCFYIAVEDSYPHRIAVNTLHPTYEAMGEILWNEGLDKILTALKSDPTMKNYEVWRQESNHAKEIEPEFFMLNKDPRFQSLIELG